MVQAWQFHSYSQMQVPHNASIITSARDLRKLYNYWTQELINLLAGSFFNIIYAFESSFSIGISPNHRKIRTESEIVCE
jgi:hypothetical protein